MRKTSAPEVKWSSHVHPPHPARIRDWSLRPRRSVAEKRTIAQTANHVSTAKGIELNRANKEGTTQIRETKTRKLMEYLTSGSSSENSPETGLLACVRQPSFCHSTQASAPKQKNGASEWQKGKFLGPKRRPKSPRLKNYGESSSSISNKIWSRERERIHFKIHAANWKLLMPLVWIKLWSLSSSSKKIWNNKQYK